MKDQTVEQWLQKLAARDGKYGGGSAASVVGAFATGLAQYVFELQEGKKKYEEEEPQIIAAIKKAERLRAELLDLAEEDAVVFEPVMDLFKLPKDTEEERRYRRQQLDQGFAKAAQPPLDIMKKMDEVLDLFETLIHLEVRGSIVDDIAVGLIFTQATIESEKLNCDVNIKSIKHDDLKNSLTQEVDRTFHATLERSQQLRETTEKIIDNNL